MMTVDDLFDTLLNYKQLGIPGDALVRFEVCRDTKRGEVETRDVEHASWTGDHLILSENE